MTEDELALRIGRALLRAFHELPPGGLINWTYIQDGESTPQSLLAVVEAFEQVVSEQLAISAAHSSTDRPH